MFRWSFAQRSSFLIVEYQVEVRGALSMESVYCGVHVVPVKEVIDCQTFASECGYVEKAANVESLVSR
jgi:hypothetical protein